MTARERSRSPYRVAEIMKNFEERLATVHDRHVDALVKSYNEELSQKDACIDQLVTRSLKDVDEMTQLRMTVAEQRWTIEDLQKQVATLEGAANSARRALDAGPLARNAAPQVGSGFGRRQGSALASDAP